LCDLALVLFQLAVSAKSTTAADGIKAVALILEAFETDSHANHLADAVLNKLGDPLEQITNAASKIDRQQEGFRECLGAVHTVAEYIAEQADITSNAINEACTTLSQQADNIGIIKDKNAAPTNINPLTYAAIAAVQLSPSHSSLLARGWEFQRQIILWCRSLRARYICIVAVQHSHSSKIDLLILSKFGRVEKSVSMNSYCTFAL
jgi:hypothetical protein